MRRFNTQSGTHNGRSIECPVGYCKRERKLNFPGHVNTVSGQEDFKSCLNVDIHFRGLKRFRT
jgi:hypothetical protein